MMLEKFNVIKVICAIKKETFHFNAKRFTSVGVKEPYCLHRTRRTRNAKNTTRYKLLQHDNPINRII